MSWLSDRGIMIKRRQPTLLQIAVPVRSWVYRLTILLLFTTAASLAITSKMNPGFSEHLRMTITDVLVPFVDVISKPVDAVTQVGDWVDSVTHMYAQNAQLKAQNAELLKWQTVAREMEAENRALRQLLYFVPSGAASYITSRIVGDSGGPYARSALISSGTRDGVAKDQAAISDKGLVGRVIEAGQSSGRVLLLTDLNSRVPVISETSRERSIVAGNNDEMLSLLYVPHDTRIQIGERVVTSGDGGIFPPGIPVGTISSVEGGVIKVKPLVDWARLEYISIVNFSF